RDSRVPSARNARTVIADEVVVRRCREQRQEVGGDGIDQALRNDVALERKRVAEAGGRCAARRRVVNLIRKDGAAKRVGCKRGCRDTVSSTKAASPVLRYG